MDVEEPAVPKETEKIEDIPNVLMANVYQIAHLNKILPKGFKFELYDLFKKNDTSGSKKGKKHSSHFSLPKPSESQRRSEPKIKASKKIATKIEQKTKSKPQPIENPVISNPPPKNPKTKQSPGKEAHSKCEKMLQQLLTHPCSTPFLQTKENIQEGSSSSQLYLKTIEQKFKNQVYKNPSELGHDIKLMISQFNSFYSGNAQLLGLLTEIRTCFEKNFKEVNNIPFEDTKAHAIPKKEAPPPKEKKMPPPSKVSVEPAPQNPKGNNSTSPMTKSEKAELKTNIMKLSTDKLSGMINILKEVLDVSKYSETLEFDIESLPAYKCRELDAYVKANLPLGNKKAAKSKQQKPSSNSDHPNKRNDLVNVTSKSQKVNEGISSNELSNPSSIHQQKNIHEEKAQTSKKPESQSDSEELNQMDIEDIEDIEEDEEDSESDEKNSKKDNQKETEKEKGKEESMNDEEEEDEDEMNDGDDSEEGKNMDPNQVLMNEPLE